MYIYIIYDIYIDKYTHTNLRFCCKWDSIWLYDVATTRRSDSPGALSGSKTRELPSGRWNLLQYGIGCRAGRAIINFSGILNHCIEYVSFDYFSFDECFSKVFNRRIICLFTGRCCSPYNNGQTYVLVQCTKQSLYLPKAGLYLLGLVPMSLFFHSFNIHLAAICTLIAIHIRYSSFTVELWAVMNREIFEAIPIQHTSENETSIPYFVHTKKTRTLEGLSFGGFIGKSKSQTSLTSWIPILGRSQGLDLGIPEGETKLSNDETAIDIRWYMGELHDLLLLQV